MSDNTSDPNSSLSGLDEPDDSSSIGGESTEVEQDPLVERGRRRLLRLGLYVTPTILSMTALSSTASAIPTVSVVTKVRILSRIAAGTRARARSRARTGGSGPVSTRSRVAGTRVGTGTGHSR